MGSDCDADVRRWDSRYGGTDYYYGTEPNDFLREQSAAIVAGGRVLCLGEGEGRNAVFLAAQGHHVTALDQSAAGLAKAALLARERHVAIDTVRADLDDYVIAPAAWDAIVSIWCHVRAPLRRRLHRAVAGGLRPGGVFVLEAYTPAQLRLGTGGPTQPELLATLAELREELAGLEFVHGVERERIVSEGKKHVGLSAVVQVLARRP